MGELLQFPGNRVTPEDLLQRLGEQIAEGKVEFMLVVTMGPNTHVKTAMTTTPAHCAIYMNQLQRMSIEELMRDKEMIP